VVLDSYFIFLPLITYVGFTLSLAPFLTVAEFCFTVTPNSNTSRQNIKLGAIRYTDYIFSFYGLGDVFYFKDKNPPNLLRLGTVSPAGKFILSGEKNLNLFLNI